MSIYTNVLLLVFTVWLRLVPVCEKKKSIAVSARGKLEKGSLLICCLGTTCEAAWSVYVAIFMSPPMERDIIHSFNSSLTVTVFLCMNCVTSWTCVHHLIWSGRKQCGSIVLFLLTKWLCVLALTFHQEE